MKPEFMDRIAKIIAEVRTRTYMDKIDTEVLEELLKDELIEYHNEVFTYGHNTGYDDGYSDGYSKGYDEGYSLGCDEDYSEGHYDGYLLGCDDGYDKGYAAGVNGDFKKCAKNTN